MTLNCIIMRGISGTGKSTRVKEILKQLGGTHEENVFSTDDFYIPVALKLRRCDTTVSDEEMERMCNEIVTMWYSGGWNDTKKLHEANFLVFKKYYDEGCCYEALVLAKSMAAILEKVEYTSNWHGSKLKYAHSRNFDLFKVAIDARKTPVVVDNTNVDAKACRNYVKYANEAGYELQLEEPTSDHWKNHKHLFVDKYANKNALEEFARLLVEKNTHGVPMEGIERQISNWKHNLTLKEVLE